MLALRGNRAIRGGAFLTVASIALVLLRQEIHCEVNAVELTPWHFEISRRLGAASHRNGVECVEQRSDWQLEANLDASAENDALRLHLCDPAIDQPFLHFEIGDAI